MKQLTVWPRYDREQVGTQFTHVAMSPSSIIHIELPVIITKNKLVNGLRTVYNILNQWLSKCIYVGTFRLVRYSNTYTSHFALMHIVGTKEKVELVVGLYDGRSPKSTSQPADILLFQYTLMLGPIH